LLYGVCVCVCVCVCECVRDNCCNVLGNSDKLSRRPASYLGQKYWKSFGALLRLASATQACFLSRKERTAFTLPSLRNWMFICYQRQCRLSANPLPCRRCFRCLTASQLI
jgi:hypothetical protein